MKNDLEPGKIERKQVVLDMTKIVDVNELQQTIGDEAFNNLVTKHPGKLIYIPKKQTTFHYDKKSRNKIIKEDYFSGLEIAELMIKYSLSKSRIYKIIEMR